MTLVPPWAPWGGPFVFALGLIFLLRGHGRAFRWVATLVGTVGGYLAGPLIAPRMGIIASPATLSSVSAAVTGLLGLIAPLALIFLLGAIPLGLLASRIGGVGDGWIAFVIGGILGGALALVINHPIRAVLSSLIGGCLCVVGGLSWIPMQHQSHWVWLTSAAVLALSGIFYQLTFPAGPKQRQVDPQQQVLENKKGWRAYTAGSK